MDTNAYTDAVEALATAGVAVSPPEPLADPLLGFSPDEIVVGPGGQTLTGAATTEIAARIEHRQALARGYRSEAARYGELAVAHPGHPGYADDRDACMRDAERVECEIAVLREPAQVAGRVPASARWCARGRWWPTRRLAAASVEEGGWIFDDDLNSYWIGRSTR